MFRKVFNTLPYTLNTNPYRRTNQAQQPTKDYHKTQAQSDPQPQHPHQPTERSLTLRTNNITTKLTKRPKSQHNPTQKNPTHKVINRQKLAPCSIPPLTSKPISGSESGRAHARSYTQVARPSIELRSYPPPFSETTHPHIYIP